MTDSLTAGVSPSDFAAKVALAAEGGSVFTDRINMLRQAEEAAIKAKQDLGIAGDAAAAYDEAVVSVAEAKAKVAKAKLEAEEIVRRAQALEQELIDKANVLLLNAETTGKAAASEVKALKTEADKALKAAKAEAQELVRAAKANVGDIEKASSDAQAALAEALVKKTEAEAIAATLGAASHDFLAVLKKVNTSVGSLI